MYINKFYLLLLFTFSVSCTQPANDSQKSTPDSETNNKKKAVSRLIFTEASNFYGERPGYLKNHQEFEKLIKNDWENDFAFPQYRMNLSILARHLQSFQGEAVSSGSLMKFSPKVGLFNPWVIQSYFAANGYGEKDFAIWARKVLGKHMETHKINSYGFTRFKGKNGEDILILLMQRRRITLNPFPKWIELSQPLIFIGQVQEDLSDLKALVTLPDGKVVQTGVALRKDKKFKFSVRICEKNKDKGNYHFEFMAQDKHGPAVLAMFNIACGKENWQKPKPLQVWEKPQKINTDKFVEQVISRINKYRKTLGYKDLKLHNKLNTASANHSQDMCKLDKLMHISPNSGSPDKRVEKLGLKPQLLAENVAVGSSPKEIVNGWITSEGHRLNLQLQDITHAGIGVCRKELEGGSIIYYATLLLAKL
ncbi:MAG: CAP domain-containing protein [Deltaproteobacteria bacterium]|nr:CAP domain-containing protein [Deltaproteobacteria bacterium]